MDGSESVQVDIRITSDDQPKQQLGNTLSEAFTPIKVSHDDLSSSNAPWGGVIKNPFVDNHKQKRSPCHFEVVYDTSTGTYGVETAQESSSSKGAAFKKRLAASLRDSVELGGTSSSADDGIEKSSVDKLLGQIYLITEVFMLLYACVCS
jgi:hypothetical protein